MSRKIFLIVTAGGSGTRMGAALPKQFLSLGGRAILRRSMEPFIEACPGIQIITSLHPDYIESWQAYCLSHNFIHPQQLVEGGFTRFHSVKNALERVPDGALVAVHDGVRPFVSPGLIRRMVERMDAVEALIPVLPSVDTLRRLLPDAEGKLSSPGAPGLDRSEIYCVQTPQFFRSERLKAAYTQPYDLRFTDDSSVAENYGIPLSFIEGERYNLKITTADDLRLGEALVSLG